MNMQYVGENAGMFKIYFLADGDRPVLEISVMKTDGSVKVGRVDGPLDDILATKGMTHIVDVITENGASKLPCMNCLAVYVVPRIVTLMARVYAPVQTGLLDVDLTI
jgi:hypothetical protein